MVPGGTVRYRDVDYRIDYGTVDLTDPKRLNPYVDFRGHTRVAEYEIALHVEGTMDRVRLRADVDAAAASSQDIISLLVTGRTLDTLSGSASAAALPGRHGRVLLRGPLELHVRKADPETPSASISSRSRRCSSKGPRSDGARHGRQAGQRYREDHLLAGHRRPRRSRPTRCPGTPRDVPPDRRERHRGRRRRGAAVRTPVRRNPDRGRRGTERRAGRGRRSVVQAEDGTPIPDLVKRTKIHVGDPFDARAHAARRRSHPRRLREERVPPGDASAPSAASDPGPPRDLPHRLPAWREDRTSRSISSSTAGEGSAACKKALKAFWSETPYTPEFWDEATHALIDELQESGYYAADVTWHAPGRPAGRIDPDPRGSRKTGAAARLALHRSRVAAARAGRKAGGLAQEPEHAQAAAAPVASRGGSRGGARALPRGRVHARPHQPPQIALSATGDSAEVDVAIHEGPRFTVGDVTINADVAAVSEDGTARRRAAHRRRDLLASPARRNRAVAEGSIRRSRLPRRQRRITGGASRLIARTSRSTSPAGDRRPSARSRSQDNLVTQKQTIATGVDVRPGRLRLESSLSSSRSSSSIGTALFSNVKLTFAPHSRRDGTVAEPSRCVVDEVTSAVSGPGRRVRLGGRVRGRASSSGTRISAGATWRCRSGAGQRQGESGSPDACAGGTFSGTRSTRSVRSCTRRRRRIPSRRTGGRCRSGSSRGRSRGGSASSATRSRT